MKQPKYEVGARVVSYRRIIKSAGTVVKTARVNLLVQWDGGREERVRVDDVRPESPEDVARREKAGALAHWRTKQPNTPHLTIQGNYSFSNTPAAVVMFGSLSTPVEMRAAAEELRALADWFDMKPSVPE